MRTGIVTITFFLKEMTLTTIATDRTDRTIYEEFHDHGDPTHPSWWAAAMRAGDNSVYQDSVYQEALRHWSQPLGDALLGGKESEWTSTYECTNGRACRDRLGYFFHQGKDYQSITQQVIEESCNLHPQCVSYEFSLGGGFMCSTTRSVEVELQLKMCTTSAFTPKRPLPSPPPWHDRIDTLPFKRSKDVQ